MDADDLAPPPRQGDPLALVIAQDLEPFSVAELDARIARLDAERARTQAHRDKAVQHRASAEALFGR
ncbi:MAG: DUF1192 domain-containing protein [Sphingomonadaceae bacterium]